MLRQRLIADALENLPVGIRAGRRPRVQHLGVAEVTGRAGRGDRFESILGQLLSLIEDDQVSGEASARGLRPRDDPQGAAVPATRRIIFEYDRFLPVDVTDLLYHRVELRVSSGLIIGLLPEKLLETPVVRLSRLDLMRRMNHRLTEQDHAEKLTHFNQCILAVLASDG